MKLFLYFLLLTILFTLGKNVFAEQKVIPLASEGEINISNWDFLNDGSIPLNGQWDFFWDTLLTPELLKNQEIKPDGRVSIPGYWNNQVINDKTFPGHGKATLRLKIICNQEENLILDVKEIMTAVNVFFDDKNIGGYGKVGNDKDSMIPHYVQQIIHVHLKPGEHVLLIQASNFYHRNGGVFDPIRLGEESSFQKEIAFDLAFDLLLFGSILIMALYHLGFFFFRRKESGPFWFGLLCLMVALRIIVTGEQTLTYFFPSVTWEFANTIEYISFFLAPTFFVAFISKIFPNETPRWFVKVISVITVALSLFALFFSGRYYTYTANYFQIFMLAGIIFCLYILIQAIRHKRDGVLILLAGISALLIGAVNDILYNLAIIHTIELSGIMLFIFILFQSFVLSARFSKAFTENEELNIQLDYQNKNLEKIVEERTYEISCQKEEILTQKEELIKVNEELEMLSIVASKTDNAVVIANDQGIIEWANEGFTNLFGYTLEEFKEEHGANIIKSSFNEDQLDALLNCAELKKSVSYTNEISGRNGETKWVNTTLTPILDDTGNIKRYVTIDSDITDLKLAEAEIKQRNEEITSQSELLIEKNKILEKQNIQIFNSLNYARLIQEAILPSREVLKKELSDFVLFFQPRDIVSGDFYWFAKKDQKYFIAVVDCTGHGVPGAFMSMIGNTLLNQIVNQKGIVNTAQILDHLNEGVIYSLQQGNDDAEAQDDGMDASICCIDRKEGKMRMALANHTALVKRKGKIELIDGDHYSIGGVFGKGLKTRFNELEYNLNELEFVYMFSDGYQDQFGGPNGNKFYLKNFKNLIEQISGLPAEEQEKSLIVTLNEWKRDQRQIDDILVLGFPCK